MSAQPRPLGPDPGALPSAPPDRSHDAVAPTPPLARRRPAIYAVVSAVLIVAVSVGAALDAGLSSVYFPSLVLLATYLGVILPFWWATGFAGAILIAAVAVHAITPEAGVLGVVSTIGMVVVGWAQGVICSSAHGHAQLVARRLSRCDVLSGTLNRRGLIEQLEFDAQRCALHGEPIALLVIDLDGFKAVNTQFGNAEGDALLAWVGETLNRILPPRAAAGRLGSDEFAVTLPGVPRHEAPLVAQSIRDALASRHPASIGVATSQDSQVSAIDLLRVADAGMRQSKQDPNRAVTALVAGAATLLPFPTRRDRAPDPSITYAALRARGGRPSQPDPTLFFGRILRDGFFVLGASGAVIVAIVWAQGDPGGWDDLVRYGGVPWTVVTLALGAFNQGKGAATGARLRAAMWSSWFLVGVGVGAAALADGGITAPIITALAVNVLFDSSLGTDRQARGGLAVMVGFYGLAAILGPSDDLWAVPIGLILLVAAYALGSVSRRALAETTAQWLWLARTDTLTGLANRRGFLEASTEAIDESRLEHRRLAVIVLDLDGFKRVNEVEGSIAGDVLLQRVAHALQATVPDAASAGRLGADEFVLSVAIEWPEDVGRYAAAMERALDGVIGASTGAGVFPDDGDDVERLLRTADERCHAAKAGRG